MGFRREGRPPGIRNDLWVFPIQPSLCAVLRDLRAGYHKPYWIDSVSVLDEACLAIARSGDDADIIMGLAANPAVCGVLFAGCLPGRGGDDPYTRAIMRWISAARDDSHTRSMIMDWSEPPGEGAVNLFGVILDGLAAGTTRTRVSLDMSNLRVGIAVDPAIRDARLKSIMPGFSGWLELTGARVSYSCRPASECALELASAGAQIIIRADEREDAIPCTVPVIALSPSEIALAPKMAISILAARFLETASGGVYANLKSNA
jgi:hypothetical protein